MHLLSCGVGHVGRVGNGQNKSLLRLQCMHTLHLLEGLNFDPPGSTHHWCHLLPKLSASDMKQCALLVEQVNRSLDK